MQGMIDSEVVMTTPWRYVNFFCVCYLVETSSSEKRTPASWPLQDDALQIRTAIF